MGSKSKCLKCESGSSRIQPAEGPSRGLLPDCEIFGNLLIAFVSSFIPQPDNTVPGFYIRIQHNLATNGTPSARQFYNESIFQCTIVWAFDWQSGQIDDMWQNWNNQAGLILSLSSVSFQIVPIMINAGKLWQSGSKWQVIYTFSWLCGGWCKCTRVDILFQLLYWYSLLRGNCFIIGAVITTSQLVVRDQIIFSRAVTKPSCSFTVPREGI